jgi:guanylate kinase
MAAKVMTSIYLTPSQKKALSRRAKQRHATVSDEIRTALDRHLERDDEGELQLGLLAGEADKALTRMIGKLDEAHAAVNSLKRSLVSRKR